MIEISQQPQNQVSGLPVFLAGITLGALTALVLGHEEGRQMVEKVIDKLKDTVEDVIEEEKLKTQEPAEPLTFRTPTGMMWRVDQ